MSAIKIDNAWLKILAIKIKENGEWVDHQALYARHSGEWYLIDLGAEASGPSIYLWKAYADDALGNGASLSPDNKSFIGFSAGHESETVDLTDPSIFDWTQLKFYTWRAYADDNQGTGISLDSTDKAYIGIAYNQSMQVADISDPSIFSWTLASGGLTQGDVDDLIDGAFSDFIASDHNQQAIVTINGIIDQFNTDLDAETDDLVRKTEIDTLKAELGDTYATQLSLQQVTTDQDEARATSVEAIETNLNENFASKVSLNQVRSTADGAADSVSVVRGVVEDQETGLSASYNLAQSASQTAEGFQESITNISNTVGNNSAGLVQQVNSISARAFLGVNASNRITGVFIDGSDTESSIELQADKVSFVTPGGVSKLYWSGSDLIFDGTIRLGGTALTTSNTINSNTQWSDVAGTTNAPANNATANSTDAQLAATAATNANNAGKTAGTVGGWNISSVAMWSGTYQGSNAFATSGMTLHKDGAIRAKEFRIDTDGSAYFKGTLNLIGSNIMVLMSGTPFGSSNQFIEWKGPKSVDSNGNPIMSNVTEGLAITYVKVDGSSYFGGSLSAGILRSATVNTTKAPLTAGAEHVIIGPFNSNGSPKTVVISYDYGASSTGGSSCPSSMTQHNYAWQLQRKIGTGSWTTMTTGEFTGPTTCEDEGSITFINSFSNGSITFTDNNTSTSDFTYRIVGVTYARFHSTSNVTKQSISLVSTEE